MVFKAEDDGQRRGGRNSAVEESSDDGYGVIGGAAGAASALVRRHTRTERGSRSPISGRLAGFHWRGAAPQTGKRWANEASRFQSSASRNEAHGVTNAQIDTDDVADAPAASPGRRARGGSANECERLGHTKQADCHRLPSLRMVDQYRVSPSRAWSARLLWLRCGWTTYVCGRPPHRGSG